MYESLFLTLSLFVVVACRRSHHRHRYPSVLGLALRIIPVRHLQLLVGSLGLVARWLPLYRLSSLPATGGGAEEGICHHCCFNRRRRLWCVTGFAVPFSFVSAARFFRNKQVKRE